jgi:hypothetical protein
MATFAANGAATLFHDNTARLATTSSGIDVTGTVTADDLKIDGTDDDIQINDTSLTKASLVKYIGFHGSDGRAGYLGYSGASGTGSFQIYNQNNTAMTFHNNSSEAVRITSGGDLLVSKTAAGTGTVGVEARSDGLLAATRDGNQPLLLNRKTSDGSIALFQKDGSTVGSIRTASSAVSIESEGAKTGLLFGGDNIYPRRSGSFSDGTNSLGGATYRFKDLYLSGTVTADGLTVNAINGGQIGGNRNLIINGAMQAAQRGDVTGISSNSYGGPDRFRLNVSGLGTFSISQSTTAPDGFANSYKLDCTTADASPAAGDLLRVNYFIEGQDLQGLAYGTSGAKAITLSFYVRSNKTGTYNIQFQQPDNSFKHAVLSYTIDSADTWEFKSITVAGDTAGIINNDNGSGLSLNWVLGAGSNYTSGSERPTYTAFANADIAPTQTVNLADNTANEWYLTGVQLEVGEQATSFEHRSFGDELARCQRYYYRLESSGDFTNFAVLRTYSTTKGTGTIYAPVSMRSAPTATNSAASNFSYSLSALSPIANYTQNHPQVFTVDVTGAFTANGAASLENGTGSGAGIFIAYDAEL